MTLTNNREIDPISNHQNQDDIRWMRAALSLARRGVGQVAPNPTVGCILVKDGHVVGRGWTKPGGRPHAETVALAQAGDQSQGATAYVTLEPCAHHGKTPPCAQALINAGIVRVVISIQDPDARVAGRGVEMLRHAGINVRMGVLSSESVSVNAGFLSRITRGRPFVTAKLATSLDARVATVTGESKWITGEEARNHGHLERARHDAILVGAGTVRADKPNLNCRLPGLEDRSPLRVVLKGKEDLPEDWQPDNDDIVTWIFEAEEGGDYPDPRHVLEDLGDCGINSVLIEGGPKIISAFMKAGLIDRLLWYRADTLLGGDGRAAIDPLDIEGLTSAPRFILAQMLSLGQDRLDIHLKDGVLKELELLCSPE